MFAPEDMLLVAGSPGPAPGGDRHPGGEPLTGVRGRPGDLRPGAPAAQRPAPGDPRGQAGRDELRFWDGDPPRRRAARSSRAAWRRSRPSPSRSAGRTPRSPRTRAGLTAALRDERPAPAGRDGPRRARPAAGRDGREGGLERDDADRAAPRRPRLRARGSRPGRVRLARPAADGDPRPQAGRARPPHRARRPTAAAPPRRRLQRARPRPARAPRPADRRAAPGVRDDDHARTTSTRPCAPPAPSWSVEAAAPTGAALVGPRSSRRAVAVTLAPRPDGADRRPAAGRRPRARASRRSCGWPGPRSTWDALVAERVPGRDRRLPAGRDRGRRAAGRGRPADRRPRSSGCARGELLAAFRTAPGGFPAAGLRVRVRRV